ncbi:hypothetical protein SAMD00019534_008080 [Acytostelium subglobosum LB1]|uniref:hypothetical protein n=1 Tax=Acytostelium subglobosum LB1 TaxID=1410327 RepID=UPI000644CF7B|nr:hypothetical protein SAMD00019534_008080 [Acytostelium subglobosum LB1]GAM17633.1 hypothetical protein SAMD00019534_008080 [Acytostelium subglobosum LB1]|eukprot:XP_012758229.1 hypothetical protein SAMD00019534_008080 [Acytostelium subglobosum LB1]
METSDSEDSAVYTNRKRGATLPYADINSSVDDEDDDDVEDAHDVDDDDDDQHDGTSSAPPVKRKPGRPPGRRGRPPGRGARSNSNTGNRQAGSKKTNAASKVNKGKKNRTHQQQHEDDEDDDYQDDEYYEDDGDSASKKKHNSSMDIDDADVSEEMSAMDDDEDEDMEDEVDFEPDESMDNEDEESSKPAKGGGGGRGGHQRKQHGEKTVITSDAARRKKQQRQQDSVESLALQTTSTTTLPSMSSPPRSARLQAAAANKDAAAEHKTEEQPAVPYHCDYCQKDISSSVRIRCSVCEDFDLCLECFSVGVEITPHKNYHDYHVVDNMHFPMFTEDWGADEELLLLEAVEMFRMGNWNEVSENVGHKSPMECKTHYFTYYLNTNTSPLPDVSKVLTTNETVNFKRAKATKYNPTDRKKGPQTDSEGPSGPVTDSVGFMKNRGQFESEFDNDAEVVVKDLTFEQDDTTSDRETKHQVLEAYSHRLDERIRRRNFIIEKGLLEYKKIERKRLKTDKEIYNSMKVFLQVMSKEDHEKLVNGIIAEKNMRERIEQLQNYRMNGVRTQEESLQYDEDKRKRDAERNLRKTKSDLAYHTEKPPVIKNLKQMTKEKEEIFLGIGKGATERKSLKIRKNVSLEMDGLPNVDALSVKEKQLCSNLRLLPHQYLLIKELLIGENLKTGKLKLSTANKLLKLESAKVVKIYEFFEQSGWIKRDGPAPAPASGGLTQNITSHASSAN